MKRTFLHGKDNSGEITMSWFEQLKMIPSNKNTLAFVIVNAAQTAKAVEDIKNLKTEPQKLKDVLRQVDAGTIDLQKLKDLYGQPPFGDQTIEQMQENIQKLKEAASFMTIDDVRRLLNEAMEAKSQSNQQKVDEILEEIEQNANLGKRTLQSNRDIRDALDILREKSGKSVIMFENPPSNEQLLADFAEAIGGELKEGSILTDLKDNGELVALMVPKRSKKTKEIIDDDATITQKDRVKQTYNKIMRNPDGSKTNTKMLFVSGSESVEVDDLVRQKKIFVATGEKMEIVEPFTGASVMKYISAVDNIAGSVRAFRPKKFPNGSDFASVIFLDKSSPKSLNVNPFVKIILTNDFPNDWAKPFFNSIRVQQLLTEEQATETIIEEIYQALIAGKTSTDRKFNIRAFTSIDGLGSKSRKQITSEIRKIISDSERIQNIISTEALNRQKEQLTFLEGNFTIKEATAYINSLEDELFYEEGEDFTVEYFRDGYDTKFLGPDLDENGNEQYDESGQKIMRWYSGKEKANYAVIKVIDDETGELKQVSPKTAYKEGVRGKTAELSESAKTKTEETLSNLKQKLETAMRRKAKLPKDKLESISRQEEKIKNLKRDIAQTEKRLEGKKEIDISAQTETLRQEVLNMEDFEAYIIMMGKKLKDSGGLIKLADTLENKASALETITPERSLSFFAQVDELVGDEEVRESFKTIDANPDSAEAQEAAKKLNDNMPNIIENIKKQIIEGFKLHLEKFVKNPASFPDNQVILANKRFLEANIIRQQVSD
jgi:hypothetical protein